MPETEAIGVQEVWRGVQAIRGDIAELSAQVALRPDWQDLQRAEAALITRINAEVQIRSLERHTADKAIAALEEWNAWAVRIVAGAAVTGVLGLAITRALG